MEPAAIPAPALVQVAARPGLAVDIGPVSAMQTPSDIDMIGTPGGAVDEGSDAAEEEEGLFAGGDDDEENEESGGEDAMEEVETTSGTAVGVKRKLVEEEDYD